MSEQAKFTPGPWDVRHDFKCTDGSLAVGVAAAGPRSFGAVAWPHGGSEEEEIANARLISAAPDLLAACQFMLKHGFERKWEGDERGFAMLSKSVKKALGQ